MRHLRCYILITTLFSVFNYQLWADQYPTNWTVDKDLETSKESTIVQGGSYSCKIVVNSGTQSNCDLINQSAISVNPGDDYTIEFWYQTSSHVKGRIVLYWNGDSPDYGGYTSPNVTSWTQFSETGVIPAGCDSLKIGLRYYDIDSFTAPETQYLDNISFESPDGNYRSITNNGFESWISSPLAGTVYISEVSDAENYHNEFLELYNNSEDIIDLTDSKLIMQDDGTVFDIKDYTGAQEIQPHSLFIIARGNGKSSFESEWGTLPEGVAYNEGSTTMYFGTSTARRWVLKDRGTSDTDDGILIDDTEQTVAGADKRHYQDPIGTWNEGPVSTATPGELEGDQDSSLPVELQDFSAQPYFDKVSLSWTTFSEIENQGFILYRKSGNGNFQTIASYLQNPDLVGQGTTSEQHDYQYMDTAVQPGRDYSYLLSDIDYQGMETKHYTMEITLRTPVQELATAYLGAIYPNPFNTCFTIPITLNDALPIKIEMFNTGGKLVKMLDLPSLTPGSHHIPCTAEGLSTGIYLLRIKVGAYPYYKKLVFLK